MSPRPTPEELRRATFRVVFRGYDQGEVESRLEEAAESLAELTAERDRLLNRLGELAERDLKSEFETVGREVTAVLEAARAAADTMRERASGDATRWRSEATAEAETMRREARADAEGLRSDAWTTGTQLLDQVMAEVARIRESAERDSLSIMGEAEREAHRLGSSARREAEDVIRTAKMEAERLVSQARSEHDEIIASAHRQAETAQERTRALEQRRKELMAEMEQVRAALSSFETELEDKRQGIGQSEPPELPRRAVVSDEKGTHVEDWEEGHTVRVIRPSAPADGEADEEGESGDETDADALAAEVARLRADAEREAPVPEPEPEPPSLPDQVPAEPEEEAGPPVAEGREDADEEPGDDTDDVFDLFRSLRHPDESPGTGDRGEAGVAREEPAPAPTPVPGPPAREHGANGGGLDVFATRERLLLPLTNSALRSVKRTLTDFQNQALERLRVTDGAWQPEQGEMGEALRPDLDSLRHEAAEAGLEAAGRMGVEVTGGFAPEPEPLDVGDELTEAVTAALAGAGVGSRERSAAVSRVFRGWRTDEAERLVRYVAQRAYHDALAWALASHQREWRWLASGRQCPRCRQAEQEGERIPPVHRDCTCTIVAV